MNRKKNIFSRLFTELSNDCRYEVVAPLLERISSMALKIADKIKLNSLLHVVAEKSSCETPIVALLLLCSADTSATNKNLKTPLHIALEQNDYNFEMIEQFLKFGAPVNAKDRHGFSSLHVAVGNKNCDLQVITALINHGADVNQTNNKYHTPLQTLFHNKFCNVSVLKLLLDHGAIIHLDQYRHNTLLSQCLTSPCKNLNVVKELIKRGEDVMATDKRGNSVLHLVVESNRYDILLYFLNTFSMLNVNAQRDSKCTPLHLAVVMCDIDVKIVPLLLEYGAKVDARNAEFSQPLHCAIADVCCPDVRAIEMLLDAKASVSALSGMNDSPLGIAIGRWKNQPSSKLTDTVKILLKYAIKQSFEVDDNWQFSRFKKTLCRSLCPDVHYNDYNPFYPFIQECRKELIRMKTSKIHQDFSLFDIISENYNACLDENIIQNILKTFSLERFPLYQHCILVKLPKSMLWHAFQRLQNYPKFGCVTECKREIILPTLCVENIGKFLDMKDLFNFCLAFYNSTDDTFLEDQQPFKKQKLQ